MNNETIKIIQSIIPTRQPLKDLVDSLKHNNIKQIAVDVLSTNYNKNLIFKDIDGIYYEFPVDSFIRTICGRQVEDYDFTYSLCAHCDRVPDWLKEKNLNLY